MADERPPATATVEIAGLSVYARIGVTEAEREVGQRLVFDIALELPDCEATLSDRVEDTVDYAEVCERVTVLAGASSCATLERLATEIADDLFERYGPAAAVSVRAAKPEPPISLSVDEVAVEVQRTR